MNSLVLIAILMAAPAAKLDDPGTRPDPPKRTTGKLDDPKSMAAPRASRTVEKTGWPPQTLTVAMQQHEDIGQPAVSPPKAKEGCPLSGPVCRCQAAECGKSGCVCSVGKVTPSAQSQAIADGAPGCPLTGGACPCQAAECGAAGCACAAGSRKGLVAAAKPAVARVAAPQKWQMADRFGRYWTHADPVQLQAWVATQDAAYPVYSTVTEPPAAPAYYANPPYATSGGACAGVSCSTPTTFGRGTSSARGSRFFPSGRSVPGFGRRGP